MLYLSIMTVTRCGAGGGESRSLVHQRCPAVKSSYPN